MGGTYWAYFTPYHQDIEKALQVLRNEVFHKRDYQDPVPIRLRVYEKMKAFREHEIDAEYEEFINYLNAKRQPDTIEELLVMCGYMGTHSILDMLTLSTAIYDYYPLYPASQLELIKWFGTDKPTRTMIEEKEEKLFDWINGRTYFVVYKSDQPDEVYFIGWSGD